MSKVIVVGGGPAGMMASISAAQNNNEVILVERNADVGRKLRLTGGGRCNITNNREIEILLEKVVTNRKFLFSAFYSFTNQDVLRFFSSKGLKYKVEKDQKVYTETDKADEVIDIFRKELLNNNVNIMYNTKVEDLIVENNIIKGIITEDGNKLYADKVIVTTGGKSHPNTGSDGSMFSILEKHGHTIKPFYPGLIPLVIKEGFVKELQGISIPEVSIKTKVKKKKIEIVGDMIFTHFGLSGPAVLKFSSHINKLLDKGPVIITLDLLIDISKEELSKVIRSNPTKIAINNLKGYLPQNYIKFVGEHLNISETKGSDLKKEDENKLIGMIKELTLTVEDTITIKAAQVTSGGVNIKEITSSTMQSKIIKNLYFAGEVMDVDAETGGYNLQIAFSTGTLAGQLKEF